MNKKLFLWLPLLIFSAITILLFRGLFLNPQHMPSALIGKPIPQFSLPNLHDQTRLISNETLKGKVTILNFWATWCPSCRIEHPNLLQLSSQGFNIVGVNYKDNSNAAKKWLVDLKDPYLFSIEDKDGQLGVNLGVYGAPETFIVDQEGIVQYRYAGTLDLRVWNNQFLPIIHSLTQ